MQICICCHVCVPEGCETFFWCLLSVFNWFCCIYKMLCSARMHITHHFRLIGNVISYIEVKTLLPGWCYTWWASPLRQRGTSYSATSWCLPLLTPRSKCTKPSSRGGGAGGSPSNERRTKHAYPGKRWCRNTGSSGGAGGSSCKHLLSVRSACFLFHLTWPRVLEHCGNTTCDVWLQSKVFVSPLVRLRGCQGSLQERRKRFFTWNKTPGLI